MDKPIYRRQKKSKNVKENIKLKIDQDYQFDLK